MEKGKNCPVRSRPRVESMKPLLWLLALNLILASLLLASAWWVNSDLNWASGCPLMEPCNE